MTKVRLDYRQLILTLHNAMTTSRLIDLHGGFFSLRKLQDAERQFYKCGITYCRCHWKV